MKKNFISTAILLGLFSPLFVSADATTTNATSTTATTVATTTVITNAQATSVQNHKICIATANKTSLSAKADAKVVYDVAKEAALKIRMDAVAKANALPVASSTEKRSMLKDAATTYKTAITLASKALESARATSQSTHKASIATCEVNFKNTKKIEAEKHASDKKTENDKKHEEKKLESEKKHEEVKSIKADIKVKVDNLRAEGKNKIEEIRKNSKASTTRTN